MKFSYFSGIIIILVLVTCACSSSKKSLTQPLIWNKQRLDTIIQKTYFNDTLLNKYITPTNYLLQKTSVSIVQKPFTISGDIHNYESLSTYYWPDPSNPQGPYIHKDGKINPDVKKYDSTRLKVLCDRLKYFSIAYYLTKNELYYQAFIEQIKIWYINKNTKMNPNLEYAQIIIGKNDNHGQPHGIIDAYIMNDIIEAIRLINSVKKIDRRVLKEVISWHYQFFNWLNRSKLAQIEKCQPNNHGIALDILKLNIALFVGKNDVANEITSSFYNNRLEKQIDSIGRQPYELKRTKAYMYSIYNLMHIVDFCCLQESLGNPYYKKHYEIINRAFLYLYQFVGKHEKFPYQEIDNWNRLEKWLKIEILRLHRLQQPPNSKALNIGYTYDFYKSMNDIIK